MTAINDIITSLENLLEEMERENILAAAAHVSTAIDALKLEDTKRSSQSASNVMLNIQFRKSK